MRGKQAKKRELKPDPMYGSLLVSKLINYSMNDGKKSVAMKNVIRAMDELGKNTKQAPIDALEAAINNVKPKMEVRSKRVGGSNFQVPLPVDPTRQLSLALRWIVDAARKARGSRQFWASLATELTNAYKKEGSAVKKKEEVHRMADANKAFSQFA